MKYLYIINISFFRIKLFHPKNASLELLMANRIYPDVGFRVMKYLYIINISFFRIKLFHPKNASLELLMANINLLQCWF